MPEYMDIVVEKKGVIPWACFHLLFTAFSRTFHWLFTAFSRFRIFRNLFAVSGDLYFYTSGYDNLAVYYQV